VIRHNNSGRRAGLVESESCSGDQTGLSSSTMNSPEEQLSRAKQRALIRVSMGAFTSAVAALRADLAENPLTKGVVSSDHAMRGYKAAMDAALGRGSTRRFQPFCVMPASPSSSGAQGEPKERPGRHGSTNRKPSPSWPPVTP
jgi:hypothetical protein